MTKWNAKKAGALYDVISYHMSTLAESERSPQLARWMLRAKKASCSFMTPDQELEAIHSGLCSYCIERMQLKCEGHQFQLRCEFSEAALEGRNSQFVESRKKHLSDPQPLSISPKCCVSLQLNSSQF